MNKKIIEVRHIKKVYGKKGEKQHEALTDISFDVLAGEFVGIMGPSGSGKTTLLNILSALDSPTSGEIEISGASLNGLTDNQLSDFRAQKIGFIFQDFNLLENLTMSQNIGLPLSLKGESVKETKNKIKNIAKISPTYGRNLLIPLTPN